MCELSKGDKRVSKNLTTIEEYEILFPATIFVDWSKTVIIENIGKRGKPRKYPQLFWEFLSILRLYLTYKEVESICNCLYKSKLIPKCPDHSTIVRRVSQVISITKKK